MTYILKFTWQKARAGMRAMLCVVDTTCPDKTLVPWNIFFFGGGGGVGFGHFDFLSQLAKFDTPNSINRETRRYSQSVVVTKIYSGEEISNKLTAD